MNTTNLHSLTLALVIGMPLLTVAQTAPPEEKPYQEMTVEEQRFFRLINPNGQGLRYTQDIEALGPEGITTVVALLEAAKAPPNPKVKRDVFGYVKILKALIVRFSLDDVRPLGAARREAALRAIVYWIGNDYFTSPVFLIQELKSLHDQVPIREKFVCEALVPMLDQEGCTFAAEILADAGDADIANRIEALVAERTRGQTPEQRASNVWILMCNNTVQAIRIRLAGQP